MSVEYGVLVGFIVLAIVVGVGAYGDSLALFIERLATEIRTALGV